MLPDVEPATASVPAPPEDPALLNGINATRLFSGFPSPNNSSINSLLAFLAVTILSFVDMLPETSITNITSEPLIIGIPSTLSSISAIRLL